MLFGTFLPLDFTSSYTSFSNCLLHLLHHYLLLVLLHSAYHKTRGQYYDKLTQSNLLLIRVIYDENQFLNKFVSNKPGGRVMMTYLHCTTRRALLALLMCLEIEIKYFRVREWGIS